MRILVVEDEQKLAQAIKKGLEQASFAVDVAMDGDHGLASATSDTHDLIILDRMLPGSVQGMDILKQMRQQNISTPVLLLTAKDQTRDRIDGLNTGADDYLVKPFDFDELLARIHALFRRPKKQIGQVLEYSDLKLDPQKYQVTRAGKKIDLTTKEFALLEYLMRNADQILTKDVLISHVWNLEADILPNTVEVYMGYLRKKIDKPFPTSALINTRRGFGYVFGDKK